MQIFWEWRQRAKKWTRYPADVSEKLSEEMDKNLIFEYEIESKKIEFDCQKLRLKNGRQVKDIRFCILNKDGAYVYWERQLSRSRYVPMFPKQLFEIESVKQEGTVDINVADTTFKIDFEKGVMIDDENEYKIRRLLSDADDIETPKSTINTRKRVATKSLTPSPEVEDVEVVDKKKKLEKVLKKREKVELYAALDEFLTMNTDGIEVYIEGKHVFSVTLNQTNVESNNNKFFILQVLKSVDSKKYWTFFRWGRVGLKGQTNLIECGNDLDKARNIFLKKFNDKTLNDFYDRTKFKKVKGKYDLVQVDYSKKDNVDKFNGKQKAETKVESKLDPKVCQLLELICDFKKMEEAAKRMSYDINKNPLGKLTKAQIKAGYQALTTIEKCIIEKKFDKVFREAVNDYYTRIPHYFGMTRPPMIDTIEMLKMELELLEMLSEIEAAVSCINEVIEESDKLHPTDEIYQKLKCDIIPLKENHERYIMINKYLELTHAPEHSNYQMKLINVYEINKHGENEKFKKDIGNRRLLWHGSRLTNWHGILSRGLKIAPKEAPQTGYMFGKGVYFADMSSKSANYCYPDVNDRGLLVLAEVALGESNIKYKADCKAAKLPEDKSSVKGVGDIGPDPEGFISIDDDVVVPCGKQIEQSETKNIKNNDLKFNEYIVYNTDQIKLRYLVEVEFV